MTVKSSTSPARRNVEHARDIRILQAVLKDANGKPKATTISPESAPMSGRDRRPPVRTQPKLDARHTRATSDSRRDHVDLATARENRQIATRTFNSNLKILSAFVKKRQENARLKLQQEGQAVASTEGLQAAEEACLALDVLRKLSETPANPASTKLLPDEQGTLLLNDRLMSLGFSHLSFSQLSGFYEQYCKRRKIDETTHLLQTPISEETLPQFLLWRPPILDKTSLDTALTFQLQLLRLAISCRVSLVPELVKSCDASTDGSPIKTIDYGAQSGLLTVEQGTVQLEVVARMMSQLSQVRQCTRQVSDQARMSGLQIAVQACNARILAQQYCFSCEREAEAWKAVESAVTNFWRNGFAYDRAAWELIQITIDRVQETCSPSTVVPDSLLGSLASLAEIHGDTDCALQYLGRLALPQDQRSAFFGLCRLVTLKLKAKIPCEEEQINLLDRFATRGHYFADPTIHQILDLIRMRKVCQHVVQSSFDATSDPCSSHTASGNCLETLAHIVELFMESLRDNELGDNQGKETVMSAYLRTVESVASLDPVRMHDSHPLITQYLATIRVCTDSILSFLEDHLADELVTSCQPSIHKLAVRLSNVCWKISCSRSMSYTNLGNSSIRLLECMSPQLQQQCGLGLRLEQAARLSLARQETNDARTHLMKAIALYISWGALVDVVEKALLGPVQEAWGGSNTPITHLSHCLLSLVKIGTSDTATEPLYDDVSLPHFHRAVLLEYQLQQLLRNPTTIELSELIFMYLSKVRSLATGHVYTVWRSRFASIMLYHLLQQHWFRCHMLNHFEPSLKDAEDVSGGPIPLVQYAPTYELLLHLQLTISGYTQDEQQHCHLLGALQERLASLIDDNTLRNLVDDQQLFFTVLYTMSEWSMVHEKYDLAAMSLRILLTAAQVTGSSFPYNTMQLSTGLASCFVQLGAPNAAAEALRIDKDNPLPADCSHEDRLMYEMALAELAAATIHIDRGVLHLKAASTFAGKVWHNGDSMTATAQMARDCFVANAALLASQISQSFGAFSDASVHARQACKIALSVWATKTRKYSQPSGALGGGLREHCGATPKGLISVMAQVSIWRCYDLLRRTINVSSRLFQHAGLYDDSVYCLSKLEPAQAYLSANTSHTFRYTLKMVQVKAQASVSTNITLPDRLTSSATPAVKPHGDAYLDLCEALLVDRDFAECQHLFQTISSSMMHKSATDQCTLHGLEVDCTGQEQEDTSSMQHLTTALIKFDIDDNPQTHARAGTQRQRARDRFRGLCYRLRQYTGQKLPLHELESLLPSPKAPSACYLNEMFNLATYTLATTEQILSECQGQLILNDSAVGIPSIKPTKKLAHRSKHFGCPNIEDKAKEILLSHGKFAHTIQEAHFRIQTMQTLISRLWDIPAVYFSTEHLNGLAELCRRACLLSLTLGAPPTSVSERELLDVAQMRNIALYREKQMADIECRTKTRAQLSKWPEASTTFAVETTFSCEDIQDLPEGWTIFVISLSNDGKELLLSKITRKQAPLLLRVPIERPHESDGDDVLGFETAQHELQDIIDAASTSSHDSRSMADKEAWQAWHVHRQALDQRLESLLYNIERLWLGGFRGLFCPVAVQTSQLRRFRSALARSLNAHLPSRRKASLGKSSPVELHDHVLEMFLGLGDSTREDFDNDILDLLYFVVDILHIHNEQNAYDEIDWDLLIVDVTDAVKSCQIPVQQQRLQQTILILDSKLESLPWESLPCLQDHPVSRMPSLASILQRVATMKETSTPGGSLCLSKSRLKGSYILNPSGDLKATQTVMEPILSGNAVTSSFNAMMNSTPGENEFEDQLKSNDVLLYFGHGSGGQYIRPKSIRALDQCAVTFLFGCSSAKMTPHGLYESTGMPRSYILGHALAVVGCLWDVTDREIDRVALKVLSEWNLLDSSDPAVKQGLYIKGQRRSKTYMSEVERENVPCETTLLQAVARGRKACALRYLCGAAVVVYGVPVALTD